jgi:hypothetical protein
MKFLYDDESFSFEALRATGFADYGGAELGEVLVTCRQIPEGDEDAWSAQWAATAERASATPEVRARLTRRTTELLSCNLQLA